MCWCAVKKLLIHVLYAPLMHCISRWLLFREGCSRCRFQLYDWSSSAPWSRFSPPLNFVNDHCRQCGTWSRYGPWPVWKQFIRDHVWRGRRQPGCRIVGSVTIVRLRTEADTMVYIGNLTLVMCRWSGLCVSVFPNVPSAPGQPCTGEDRTLYCMFFKTCYFIFLV